MNRKLTSMRKRDYSNTQIEFFIRLFNNKDERTEYMTKKWLLSFPSILKDIRYQEHDDPAKIVTFEEKDIIARVGTIFRSTSDRRIIIPESLEYAVVSLYSSDLSSENTAGIRIVEKIIQDTDLTKIVSNTSDRNNSRYKERDVSSDISRKDLYSALRYLRL